MWRSWSHGDGHWAVSTKSLQHCIDRICSHCHNGQCLAKHLLAFCMWLVQRGWERHAHFSVSNNIDHSLCPCHHSPLHNLHTHIWNDIKVSSRMSSSQAKNLRGYAMLIEFLFIIMQYTKTKCFITMSYSDKSMKLCVAPTSSWHSF